MPKFPYQTPDLSPSVIDPLPVRALKALGRFMGGDNPASQAMGLAAPLVLPKGAGKILGPAMDRASKIKRAFEQGYKNPMYHGTSAAENFDRFEPLLMDMGPHVTPDARTANVIAGEHERGIFARSQMGGSRVLPLMVKMDKTLEMPDVGVWKNPVDWASKLGYVPDMPANPQDWTMNPRIKTNDPSTLKALFEKAKSFLGRDPRSMNEFGQRNYDWAYNDAPEILKKAGYDSIRYQNFIEGKGEPSYLILKPENIRSKFAQFLPENIGKNDLMGSLGAIAALKGLYNQRGEQ